MCNPEKVLDKMIYPNKEKIKLLIKARRVLDTRSEYYLAERIDRELERLLFEN